jgi:integrase
METQKPRLKYDEVFMPRSELSNYHAGTVAWVIQRYIEKMSQRGMKALGPSHTYTLKRLQGSALGKIQVGKLKKSDVIDFCEERRQTVCPATVQQDMTFLTGDECEEGSVALQAIEAAKPTMQKHQLTGKSRPRDRRPTVSEWQTLIDYFTGRAGKARVKIPMATLIEFQVWSARRISETCRIKCADVDQQKRTVIVRDMKDPKQKKGNDVVVPLLGRAWEIVEERLKSWDGHPEARVFPYNSKSVSAAFTLAKNVLEIKNLRLHDLRREAASRLFEAGFDVQEVMLVTGHKTPQMLLRVYTKLKPEDLHLGPAKMRGLKADRTLVVDHNDLIKITIPTAHAENRPL